MEGYPQNMFLDTKLNKIIIFSQFYDASMPEPFFLSKFLRSMPIEYYQNITTKVFIIDVSNNKQPQLELTYSFPGQLRKLGKFHLN